MTYVGENGDRCNYTRSDQEWDRHRGFLFWSDQPVQPVARSYAQATTGSGEPQRRATSGRGLSMPAVIDEADAPNGLVTMTALIDEFLAKGSDRTDIETELGFTLEAMREAMRSATRAQRIALGGFRIPRGAMQVSGSDDGTAPVILLIDTCAAEHMAHPGVNMTVTGPSNVRFQGASAPSRDLVAGTNKGNLIVHTMNGPLPMFGVHHVEQIQPQRAIGWAGQTAGDAR
jgi:hypothetical protein